MIIWNIDEYMICVNIDKFYYEVICFIIFVLFLFWKVSFILMINNWNMEDEKI